MRNQHPITCTCGACRHVTPDWRGEGAPEFEQDADTLEVSLESPGALSNLPHDAQPGFWRRENTEKSMSKIETFKAAKAVADKIKRAVLCCTGRDSQNNDKARIYVQFVGLQDCDWTPMQFQIQASHGYYGSSSGYSDTSAELGEYLAKAIKQQSRELFDLAASLAQADAEAARKDAEDEARNVLVETTAA